MKDYAAPPRKAPMVVADHTELSALEKWSIDVVGPLPATATGERYILVAEDRFTKWPEVREPDKAAREPEAGDRGTRDQRIGGREIRNHRSRDQGSTDRRSRDQGSEIDGPGIGDREIRDRRIGGREIRIGDRDREIGDREIGDREIGDREIGDREIGDREIGDREIEDRFTVIRQEARNQMGRVARETKTRYDRTHNVRESGFKPGMLVMLKNPSPTKMQPRWFGPFRILEILENNNVSLGG